MPPELRYALGAFFLVVGGVAIYQKLRPLKAGGKGTAEEAGESRPSPPSPFHAVEAVSPVKTILWTTSMVFLTAAATFTVVAPEKAVAWAMALAKWTSEIASARLLKAGLRTEVDIGGTTGPLPPEATVWTWILMLVPLIFPAVLYVAVKLSLSGRKTAALFTGGAALAALALMTPYTIAGLKVVTGVTYREEMSLWLDGVSPAWPQDPIWGKEGPVVMQDFPSQYREVEPDILYRRRTNISETGEASQTETIYPFRMGPFTVNVGEGKEYVVAGIQSIDRVIVVNERLKVAGFLSGGAVESRPQSPIVIMPSSYMEWRDTLRTLWAKPRIEWKMAVFAGVTYHAYVLLTLAVTLIFFLARMRGPHVKNEREEKQIWPEQQKPS